MKAKYHSADCNPPVRSLTATQRTFLEFGVSRFYQECPAGSACIGRAPCALPFEHRRKSPIPNVALALPRLFPVAFQMAWNRFFGGVLRVAVKLLKRLARARPLTNE